MSRKPDRTLEQVVLLTMLGKLDGTMEPQDIREGPSWQADEQARAALVESAGLMPWSPLGDTSAERKASTRARDRLAAAGLVEVRAGGREARLTPQGEVEARRLAGMPSMADALAGLDFMADPARDRDRWTGGELSEATMAGLPDPCPRGKIGETRIDDALSAGVVDGLLPALAAGLVSWRVWAHGSRMFLYALTPKGRTLAEERRANGEARPGSWAGVVRRTNPGRPDCYALAWDETFRARQSARPMDENVIRHLDVCDPPVRGEAVKQFSAARAADAENQTTPDNPAGE